MKNYLMGIILLLATANLFAQRKVEKQIIVNPTTILNLKFHDKEGAIFICFSVFIGQ